MWSIVVSLPLISTTAEPELTIQKTEDVGLYAYDGMSFHCLRCHFTQCNGFKTVNVVDTKGRLTDCQITQCMGNGIDSSGFALVEINGKETTIDHNCKYNDKDGINSNYYGIEQHGKYAQIQILLPLTRLHKITTICRN